MLSSGHGDADKLLTQNAYVGG